MQIFFFFFFETEQLNLSAGEKRTCFLLPTESLCHQPRTVVWKRLAITVREGLKLVLCVSRLHVRERTQVLFLTGSRVCFFYDVHFHSEVSHLANSNVKKEIKETRKQTTTFLKQMGKKLDLSMDGTVACWATILSEELSLCALLVAALRWNVRPNSSRRKTEKSFLRGCWVNQSACLMCRLLLFIAEIREVYASAPPRAFFPVYLQRC